MSDVMTDRTTQKRSFGAELRQWQARRWLFAATTAVATVIVVAIPTDMIDTPLFTRDVPVTWWAWPVLIINGILAGLVAATYVARRDPVPVRPSASTADPDGEAGESTPAESMTRRKDSGGKFGTVGTLATFFAVGCPVCNKLVLLALGYTGAIQFFEPIQPFLALGAIGLLSWAFVARVRRERSCPLPTVKKQRAG